MQSRLIYGLSTILLMGGAALALARVESAHGPLASMTGAAAIGSKPAELNCTLCHFNFDWNNLDTPGGAVEILGLPATYAPGQTYDLTVRLHSDSTLTDPARKWGFELTAVRGDNGEGTGTFILPDPDTLQTVTGSTPYASRTYVEHTFIGTRTGLGGPVTWRFAWQAPDPAVGTVHFFCAGNAADGTDDPGQDFIFTTRDSALASVVIGVPEAPSAARATLEPPAPNPARGPVRFEYSLASRGRIDLSLFDLGGRRIRTLASGWREPARERAVWDGAGEDGARVPDGIYFAKLTVAGQSPPIVRRLVLTRD